MIQRDTKIFGRTDDNGNLKIPMYELTDFTKGFKNKRAIVSIHILEDKPFPAMIGLYRKFIIPIVVKGYYAKGCRYTEDQVDEMLRLECPITNPAKHNGIEYVKELKSFEGLEIHEAVEFLDWLKEWAAVNLHIYIPDSIRIYNEIKKRL